MSTSQTVKFVLLSKAPSLRFHTIFIPSPNPCFSTFFIHPSSHLGELGQETSDEKFENFTFLLLKITALGYLLPSTRYVNKTMNFDLSWISLINVFALFVYHCICQKINGNRYFVHVSNLVQYFFLRINICRYKVKVFSSSFYANLIYNKA